MKYKNAKDIFPENLLRQIQKYVSGELIYIPSDTQNKKEWGETSGYRRYLYERNRDIKAKFSEGATIEILAEEYHLSFDSVKKIVYNKKEVFMLEYNATLSYKIFKTENSFAAWSTVLALFSAKKLFAPSEAV